AYSSSSSQSSVRWIKHNNFLITSLYRTHVSSSIRLSNGFLALTWASLWLTSNNTACPTRIGTAAARAWSMTRPKLSHIRCNVASSSPIGPMDSRNLSLSNPFRCSAHPTRRNHGLGSAFSSPAWLGIIPGISSINFAILLRSLGSIS
ncbi:hypothetical protein V8F06_014205, partial [Rhypophila decipiens]